MDKIVEKGRGINPAMMVAIEELAMNPNMSYRAVSKKCGVSEKQVSNWIKKPEFVDILYKRYMEIAGSELPMVIGAMINEAKAGNVQAGRLILEHFGKLENKIKIQVESNFEKFMRIDVDDAEFVDVTIQEAEGFDQFKESEVELPPRDSRNNFPTKRVKDEKSTLTTVLQSTVKDALRKDKANQMYRIRCRAKAVGLKSLGNGRHSKGAKKDWIDKLKQLEIEKFGKVQK